MAINIQFIQRYKNLRVNLKYLQILFYVNAVFIIIKHLRKDTDLKYTIKLTHVFKDNLVTLCITNFANIKYKLI